MKSKISLLLLTLMAMLTLFTACQPTPDEPVVVNKEGKELEQKIGGSSGSGKYQADASWEEQVELDLPKRRLNIQADVIVPDVDKYPVAKVNDSGFTQEEADKIIAYFTNGKKTAAPRSEMSKKEIEEEILRQKRIQSALRERGEKEEGSSMSTTDEDGNEKTYEIYRVEIDGVVYSESPEYIDQRIKELEQQYPSAPEEIKDEPAVTTFRTNKEIYPDYDPNDPGADSESINISIRDDANKEVGGIYISNNNYAGRMDSYASYNSYTNDDYGNYDDSFLPNGKDWDTQPEGVKMTQAEARKLAEDLVKGLDIEGLEVYSVNKGFSWQQEDNVTEGWIARFRRKVNGVPLTVDANTSTNVEITEQNAAEYGYSDEDLDRMKSEGGMGSHFASGWSYETLTMTMDDKGIRSFNWSGRCKVLETENENVALLPFDEIKSTIKKQLPAKFGEWDASSDETIISIDHIVYKVELGLMRTAVKDKPGEYRLIPVWDVYVTEKYEYDEDKLRAQLKEYEAEMKQYNPDYDLEKELERSMNNDPMAQIGKVGWSQLTINAIDGTIIDRQKGY